MLKRYILMLTVVFSSTLFVFGSATAREWTIVGPRALGMGGANVAVANDASAGYWNPGAFGFFKHKDGGEYGRRKWSAGVDVGFGAQVHEELGEILNNITQIDFETVNTETILADNVLNFLNLVNYLKEFDDNPDRALSVAMNGGLRVQASHYGIAGYVFSDISAKGDLDLLNIGPGATGDEFSISDFTNPANYGCSTPTCLSGTLPTTPETLTMDQQDELNDYLTTNLTWTSTQSANFINAIDNGLTQSKNKGQEIPVDIVDKIENLAGIGDAAAGSGGPMENNESVLLFKGIAIAEIPVTYGYSITEDLALGTTIKYMKARVYHQDVKVFDTEFSDALSDATEDYKESQNFGIDLGLLYRFGDDLRVGLVGHNLNSPAFDMKSLSGGNTDKIKEKAQLRGGIAYKPLSFVTLAMDYDLTKNDTTIPSGNYKSQNLGGGIEINLLKLLQLRAGAYQNLAESDIGMVYTAGLGLNLWLVNIDLGASLSSDSTSIDDKDIPKEVRAELALSALF